MMSFYKNLQKNRGNQIIKGTTLGGVKKTLLKVSGHIRGQPKNSKENKFKGTIK